VTELILAHEDYCAICLESRKQRWLQAAADSLAVLSENFYSVKKMAEGCQICFSVRGILII
jgi:hypothetical protein